MANVRDDAPKLISGSDANSAVPLKPSRSHPADPLRFLEYRRRPLTMRAAYTYRDRKETDLFFGFRKQVRATPNEFHDDLRHIILNLRNLR